MMLHSCVASCYSTYMTNKERKMVAELLNLAEGMYEDVARKGQYPATDALFDSVRELVAK